MNKPTVVALTLLAAAGCGATGEPAPGAAPASAAVPVQVVTVHAEVVSRPIRVTGVLAPKDEQKLAFKIGGVIDRVLVEEGDRVRRGQVLASLKLSEIDAQVAQAEQAFQKAERDLARVERLADAKVATQEQREDARTGFEVAKNQLQIARFNREYAVITAPASGRVLKRLASVGELVGPGAPLFVLGSTEQGWVVRAALTDRDRVRAALGDAASLSFDALPGEAFAARLVELASAPSPLTGAYEVELRLERDDPRLVTGLFARGQLVPREQERVTLLPPSALLEANGQRGFVYVLSPDRAQLHRVELTLGAIHGDRVGVVSGLADGQEVVVAGAAYLVEGTPFRVSTLGPVAEAR